VDFAPDGWLQDATAQMALFNLCMQVKKQLLFQLQYIVILILAKNGANHSLALANKQSKEVLISCHLFRISTEWFWKPGSGIHKLF
jgi:hypothetical protein